MKGHSPFIQVLKNPTRFECAKRIFLQSRFAYTSPLNHDGKREKPASVLTGTAAPVRAAAGATAGGMDGNVPVRLPGREGDGPRQVHHAEGRRGRRRGQAGSFGAAAKLAATTDGFGEVRGGSGQARDRGSDRAAYTGP